MSRKSIYFVVLPSAIFVCFVLTVVLADRHVTSAIPLLHSAFARFFVGLAICSTFGILVRKLRFLS